MSEHQAIGPLNFQPVEIENREVDLEVRRAWLGHGWLYVTERLTGGQWTQSSCFVPAPEPLIEIVVNVPGEPAPIDDNLPF